MWLGQADPLYMEVGRPASGIRGGYHLPVATRIWVRKGRLKSSSRRTAPLTAGPRPLQPEEGLRCRTNPPGNHRDCRGTPPTT